MSDADGKHKATVPIGAAMGNALFERAVTAIALDDNTSRWVLVSVMKTLAATPEKLTSDDLGHLLREIDRRVRKLVTDAQADAAMKRLYRVLFEQAEEA